jgi:hypothetical protein
MRNKRKEDKLIAAIERATLETLEELLSMRPAGLKQRDEANTVATLGKVRGRCNRTSRWNEDVEALDRETDCRWNGRGGNRLRNGLALQ